ncbi:hypothetical protein [Chitinophaga sp. LS1]|uniref:hypothetical protein n=2 Tax=Chitinophaga sp. LS1 TaxID=3051176 RepID=UPI002AABD1D8|nr:hypothetical protein [Chitinophaga sp. LS1]WPV63823.1 hypothetical protein QQL36_18660 [Chitinophaga sp. LS1]WPV64235.1 hypothetical protein QQL36_20750 [Chitinophaga sp. LS1]WPV64930.1 hypothetical protein QQL36_24305 [Chitinophaga sp. LS1]WPV65705.1 hypothetical protein QQL36_28295 [Chitinophaga sp. LS1]WPV66480.1 hypothetical protein QQL36_32300 [Chitinophaga sp. LS1]
MEQSHISFEQVVSRGCGLDVHQENVVATIRGNGLEEQTRTFSTFTSSLRDLVAWLEESGITHVAMESTGFTGSLFLIYWNLTLNLFWSMPGILNMCRGIRPIAMTVPGLQNYC